MHKTIKGTTQPFEIVPYLIQTKTVPYLIQTKTFKYNLGQFYPKKFENLTMNNVCPKHAADQKSQKQ